jgi:protocadherin Fat 4
MQECKNSEIEISQAFVRVFLGSPPLTGSGIVKIVVLDVNDHSPEFARQDYKATVVENMPAGTWVTKLHATDKDEGLNARIR